ncbi:serine/threonine-protein kinase [Usitatibacter palustris]|uniref:Serine/threonine-protein kinase PknD n=1 Tax=Usitatibacter palustris TaxID=2732487 RepID=A0A6M4H8T7_9PROT|nr:serine/threonine-protein kinase [Usitatibacter palustris]QJR16129.1 Serine/threonine-protein kinase PknD [Usitatibacter palustris]
MADSSPEAAVNLSRETWKRLEPLLASAFDMEAEARERWLAGLDATEPELAPMLRRLVANHIRAEHSGSLETVPKLAPPPPSHSAWTAGQGIGPFTLERPLGRGGMGEVWLAEQSDGRITRHVALKLPAAWLSGEHWQERFRRERDILAKLTHPNIARLYDAGVTDAGQPWLAMEYVDGHSLLDAAKARSLDTNARIALFRQVLAAVSHAHRHLVVHRDLKPANILVDASGQVKLLDFGIAKLLDEAEVPEGARDLTRLGGRVMTLRYAAPEQAAGEAITTATDIYALGVLLYELLSGASPYTAVREGRSFHEATLLQSEVTAPSSIASARSLAGDLDAILLKALRRDPAARYASIEAFDTDLAAHLAHRPVAARAGTWRYLAGRFVRRHRLPIATAAGVVIALAVGLVIAIGQRERAERHFASVRSLANTIMFDLYDAIDKVDGTLAARRLLADTSLKYLDNLAAESAGDDSLQLELATAYRKVSEILGQPNRANLGEPERAAQVIAKARSILTPLEARHPDDLALLRELRTVLDHSANFLAQRSDARMHETITSAVRVAEHAMKQPGATLDDRLAWLDVRTNRAAFTDVVSANRPGALAELRPVMVELEALVRAHPESLRARLVLAYANRRAAVATIDPQRRFETAPAALPFSERALALLHELVVSPAATRSMRMTLTFTLGEYAEALFWSGKTEAAYAAINEALANSRTMFAAEPGDAQVLVWHAFTLGRAAVGAMTLGHLDLAIEHGREANAIFARIPPDAQRARDASNVQSQAQISLADALITRARSAKASPAARRADLAEAKILYAAGLAFIDRAIAEKWGDVPVKYVAELRAAALSVDQQLAALDRGAPGTSPPR